MPQPVRRPTPPIPPIEKFLEKPIALVDRKGVAEQFHLFEPKDAQAIRAALAARRPLLVRGEPGVGKTQLAAAAAKVLKRPLVPYVVDSRTESRDLLWTFDAVMRLADAQAASAFLTPKHLLGLGQGDPPAPEDKPAFTKKELRKILEVTDYVRPGPLWWAFDWTSAQEQAAKSETPPLLPDPDVPDPDVDHRNGRVVLIDEIDKADTDVPNGLLEALGSGQFTPLGHAQPVKILEPAPLVVITTNEERVLPAAFVRRCLVLHLTLPVQEEALIKFLVERAEAHFQSSGGGREDLFRKAAKMIAEERALARSRFVKPLPGQAEFLDLLRAVLELENSGESATEILDSIRPYVLQKQEEFSS